MTRLYQQKRQPVRLLFLICFLHKARPINWQVTKSLDAQLFAEHLPAGWSYASQILDVLLEDIQFELRIENS